MKIYEPKNITVSNFDILTHTVFSEGYENRGFPKTAWRRMMEVERNNAGGTPCMLRVGSRFAHI